MRKQHKLDLVKHRNEMTELKNSMKNERKGYFRYEVWTRKSTDENKHNKYVLRKVEGEKEKHIKNQTDIKERKYKYLKQAKKICTDKKSHQRKKKTM